MDLRYPLDKLESIRDMMRGGIGPVEIASRLGVSRPTANKMIAEAREHFAISASAASTRPVVLTGKKAGAKAAPRMPRDEHPDSRKADHPKAAQAARMLAQGQSKTEIARHFGLGRRQQDQLFDMARDQSALAHVARPEAMASVVSNSMDVLGEINGANARLKLITDALVDKLEELQAETAYDVAKFGEGGEDFAGWHQRQANIIKCLDTIRKVEDSVLKTAAANHKILESLYDVKVVSDMLADVTSGIRAGLTQLKGMGRLTSDVQEAVSVIAAAIQRHFQIRKGVV
jgi:DNA-binding CsgD family transcriptional regulator